MTMSLTIWCGVPCPLSKAGGFQTVFAEPVGLWAVMRHDCAGV